MRNKTGRRLGGGEAERKCQIMKPVPRNRINEEVHLQSDLADSRSSVGLRAHATGRGGGGGIVVRSYRIPKEGRETKYSLVVAQNLAARLAFAGSIGTTPAFTEVQEVRKA